MVVFFLNVGGVVFLRSQRTFRFAALEAAILVVFCLILFFLSSFCLPFLEVGTSVGLDGVAC